MSGDRVASEGRRDTNSGIKPYFTRSDRNKVSMTRSMMLQKIERCQPAGSTSSKTLEAERRLEVKNGMKPDESSSDSWPKFAVKPID